LTESDLEFNTPNVDIMDKQLNFKNLKVETNFNTGDDTDLDWNATCGPEANISSSMSTP